MSVLSLSLADSALYSSLDNFQDVLSGGSSRSMVIRVLFESIVSTSHRHEIRFAATFSEGNFTVKKQD
jgi:hypothetical protein